MVSTEWGRLAGDERVIEEWVATRVEEFLKLGCYKPIAVDDLTGTILDGYQKTAEAGHLGLDQVAVLPVDHPSDERITVEVWPKSTRTSIIKAGALERAVSGECFGLRPPGK